jgi:hypothetical protein
MTERPSEKWVGKWISVVGLMDQPYEGKHYGFHYEHVGITITDSNQINFISEKEAKYRLGSVGKGQALNQRILEKLGLSTPRIATTSNHSSASKSPGVATTNAAILQAIKRQTAQNPSAHLPSSTSSHTVSSTSYTGSPRPVAQPSLLSKYPIIWWLAFVLLIAWLTK